MIFVAETVRYTRCVKFIIHRNTLHVECIKCSDSKTYFIAVSANSHQKVVRLDITMNEVFVVNILYSTNHLQQAVKALYQCLRSATCRATYLLNFYISTS